MSSKSKARFKLTRKPNSRRNKLRLHIECSELQMRGLVDALETRPYVLIQGRDNTLRQQMEFCDQLWEYLSYELDAENDDDPTY